MKIRRTQELRLDELIKYIFDNGIKDETFISNELTESEARVSHLGNIKTSGYISGITTFTVEVEEEITDVTPLHDVTVLTKMDGSIYPVYAKLSSISDVKKDIADDDTEILKIFANIDGKPTLVWDGEEE